MEERQIVQSAIHHFSQLTGLDMKEVDQPVSYPNHRQPDTFIDIHAQGGIFSFWVEVKNELRQVHLGHLIHKLKKDPENWMLISQYISKPHRKQLKEEGVNYLDASGNCHIKKRTLFLYINDQKVTPQRESEKGKLWKPAGLRLIFSVLLKPDIINNTYRTIAEVSNIGLGTVGPLLKELEKEGYFSHYNDNYHLENRESLLNRWTEVFYSVFRPRLVQGRFRFATPNDRNNWRNIELHGVLWGGESAGALLTQYLHPEKFTLYSELSKTEVIKQLRLVPDNNGEVELLKPFWNTDAFINHEHVVPPLLAYAELNASMDSRNRETAQRIKDQYNV